ncbi:MAG: helix-hairpin-helix domain-containing protein [Dehalococcoidales bacterium]|nr:MAG: helix-hairpin-helix domain-containing protein [Dehalococcoidales bacterium]
MSTEVTSGKIVAAVVIILLLIITGGGIIIWSRYEQVNPVEISHPASEIWKGTLYIGGSVNLPGFYPFACEDTIDTLVRAAGGIADNHSEVTVTLLLDVPKKNKQAQKIDINRAEIWLLEALPGIGEIIARRIIDYRMENGKFTNILGLLEVDGIGSSIYERIKEYITVSD